MVSIILIFIAGIITFFDKEQLLKPPIKAKSWCIIGLLIASVVCQIIDNRNNKSDSDSLKRELDTSLNENHNIHRQLDTESIKLTDIKTAIKVINVHYDSITKTASFSQTINNTQNNNGISAVSLNANTIHHVKIDHTSTNTIIKDLIDPAKYKPMTRLGLRHILTIIRHDADLYKIKNKDIELYYVHSTNGREYINDVKQLLKSSEFKLIDYGFVSNNNDNISKGISLKIIDNHIALIIGNL